MFTTNTLMVIVIVLCLIIISFVFFCFFGILTVKEMLNTYIKQNQANQQKILDRIEEYRIRIDNLETLIENSQGVQSNSEIVIDEQSQQG